MFELVDMLDVETLYIASDSPSSQYRNKFNVFLTKDWAVKNEKDVYWIFTESGHGKGPMDATEFGPLLRPLLKILSHIATLLFSFNLCWT